MMNPQTSKTDDGYTLLELLVVLVIIGLLVAVAAPKVMQILGGAKSDAARLQIESLSQALDIYQLDAGQYPTTEQGLISLSQKPAGATAWRGPYVRKKKNLVDPWGKAFLYISPGKNGPYDIVTLGADGQPGGEGDDADISNAELQEDAK
jgi:general secretion pathway protein G